MTAVTHTHTATPAVMSRAVTGAVAGLAGGVVFGLLMQMMGMIAMIAMLVGSTSTAVAWLLHLVVSAAIGAGFGVVLGTRAANLTRGVVLGLVYGAVWWVLGPLLLMPAKLGMPLFTLDATAAKSLMGHLLFGVVTGAVFVTLNRRHTQG